MKNLLLVFSIFLRLYAFEECRHCPLHEAFLTEEIDAIVLEPVEKIVPRDVTELQAHSTYRKGKWIPGYWHFSKERNEFVWVSGVWREAPPQHEWIPGQWQRVDQGYIWLKGFWSRKSFAQLSPISQAPPEPPREQPPQAPGKDYFWAQGHYRFDQDSHKYIWQKGQWEKFNIDWVYVPGRYVWRGQGYVYVEPFWDYPLEKRGEAYSTLYMSPLEQRHLQYKPQHPLKEEEVLQRQYLSWPNFAALYHYYFFFKPHILKGIQVPPWWHWPQWWGFSTPDQWWNWWWWTHPKYPNPPWITPDAAASMYAAEVSLVESMKKTPPFFLTPEGVVTPQRVIHVLEKKVDFHIPVFPPNSIQTVHNAAWGNRLHTMTNIRPTRKTMEEITSPPSPIFPVSE